MKDEGPSASSRNDPADHAVTLPTREATGAEAATVRLPRHHEEANGGQIGPYHLLELLGEGGFGSVWRAEQQEPIRREVALKLIKAGMDSQEIIARFEAERQALAMMDHPNIAAVLDAGTTDNRRPFFAMELVKGVPITAYCDAKQLGIRERLELFIPVCQAVQHAHQKAILHRDLKPSNILVTEVDGKPVPKVIDFGIAKALHAATDPAFKATLAQTMEGMLVGTPQYMSPEQAGSVADVDTRSDIYTLGVILHELLVGEPPLGREQLKQAAFDEVLRLIRESEARRPSSRCLPATELAKTTASLRHTEPKRLGQALRGDLDWIVLKALEKDRTRRYETANTLALDLRRHLDDEPVSAGPPSAGYRLKKLVRRNKGAFAAGAAIILLIIGGLVSSTLLYLREKEARSRAQTAEQNALTEARRSAEVAEFMQNIFRGINPEVARGQDTTLLKSLLVRAEKNIGKDLAGHPEAEADLRNTIGVVYGNLGLDEESLTHLERALELRRATLGNGHPDTVQSIANVGVVYSQRGREAEAEKLLTEAVENGQRLLGAGHARTLFATVHLASFYQTKGRLGEAEALLTAALEGQRIGKKPETRETLGLSHRLASIRHAQGRLAEAEELYTKTLEAKRRLYGPEDPFTLVTMAHLAGLYQAQGRLAEAEKLRTSVLEAQHRLMGGEHANTLISTFNLAKLYHDQKKYAEAEKLYAHGYDVLHRQPDLKFPELPDVLADYSNLLRAQKQWDKAEKVLREEMQLRLQATGKPDAAYALAVLRLSLVFINQKPPRIKEAEAPAREALEVRLEATPDSWRRFQCESYLGRVLLELGKPEEAEPLLLSGYEGMKEKFNANPPSGDRQELRLAALRLSRLAEAKGDAEGAKKWQMEADKLSPSKSKDKDSDE